MSEALDLAIVSTKTHEGCNLQAYPDRGGWSIGWGTYIPTLRIDQELADRWLEDRIMQSEKDAQTLVVNYSSLSAVRQAVLIEMVYQMGREGVGHFHGMLGAIEAGDFELAANQGLDSLWARQTPSRAQDLMEKLRLG